MVRFLSRLKAGEALSKTAEIRMFGEQRLLISAAPFVSCFLVKIFPESQKYQIKILN